MIALPAKCRPFISCLTAASFAVIGIISVHAIPDAIDWNIIMMIFGTVIIVDYFIQSKMPNLIADKLLAINSKTFTKAIIIRMRSVPAIDTSAMRTLRELTERANKKDITDANIITHPESAGTVFAEACGYIKGELYRTPIDLSRFADYLNSFGKVVYKIN